MAEIIELGERRRQQEHEKADALRDDKIAVLRKVLQCAHCQLKCSRCGVQIEEAGEIEPSMLPYPLCSDCEGEYEVYAKLRRGETPVGHYWHNKEWMEMWRSWLNHQQALDQYRNSKEFLKLVHEFESLW